VKTLRHRTFSKWSVSDADERVLHFDIQRLDELFKGWDNDPLYNNSKGLDFLASDGVDLIIGGPPCQSYSLAGRIRDDKGMTEDYRNFLFESYVAVVKRYNPKAIVFENVPGMLSAAPGGVKITDRIRKSFDSIGYEIIEDIKKYAVINAADFGVPQIRKRVILIALNRNIYSNTQKTLKNFYTTVLNKHKVEEHSTVKDAIYDLPCLSVVEEDYRHNSKRYSHTFVIDNKEHSHTPRYHSRRDIKIFNKLTKDIELGERQFISIKALQDIYTEMTGKTSNFYKYKVLEWGKPSNAIVAHL
jgi:DNA (cytosine-5)-methyltransferase 1